jgi:hypothetical protein
MTTFVSVVVVPVFVSESATTEMVSGNHSGCVGEVIGALFGGWLAAEAHRMPPGRSQCHGNGPDRP